MLALGLLLPHRVMGHQEQRVARRAHAGAPEREGHRHPIGSLAGEGRRGTVAREGQRLQREGGVGDHAHCRWEQHAHVAAEKPFGRAGEEALRLRIGEQHLAKAVEGDDGIAREREEPRQRAVDATFPYAVDPADDAVRSHVDPRRSRLPI